MGQGSKVVAERKERHDRVKEVREKILGRTEDFQRALAGIIPAETFAQVALTAVTENSDLQECSVESILLAALKAAQAGLLLDGTHAALIPYKRVATFTPMVQGVTSLISRSPKVLKVEARAVREGDEFSYSYGLTPHLEHVPQPGTKDRKVEASYAIVFWREGPPTFEVVDRDEIEQARLTSRAPESPAWMKWYGEMARKVAVHRVKKYVDLDPRISQALAHAMDAEWDVEGPEVAERFTQDVTQRIQGQVDDTKRRLLEVQSRRAGNGEEEGEEAPEPEPEREPTEEEVKRAQEGKLANLRKLVEFHWGDDPLPADLEEMDEEGLRELLDQARGVDAGEGGELPLGLEVVAKKGEGPAHLVKSGELKAVGCGHDTTAMVPFPVAYIPTDPTQYCARCLRWVDSHASADDTPAPVLEALLALADLEKEASES